MNKKKTLVTGASNGIGRVFALNLANEGYAVTCVARNEERLKSLVKELGNEHQIIIANLTQKEGIDKVIQEIEANSYDLLINNAGYAVYGKFNDIPLEKHLNVIELNVNALVRLTYSFLKKAKKGDALINVSSILSRLPYPGGGIYSGSKGFVTNFTESLWYEYKQKGIYIMALLPGVTNTDFHKVAIGDKVKQVHNQKGYPPEIVVDEALKALRKRKKPVLISGPKFRYLTFIVTKFVGRKNIIEMMGQRSPGMKL